MKNIISIIIVLVVIVSIGMYVSSRKTVTDLDTTAQKEETLAQDEQVISDTQSSARYVEYSKTAFDQASDVRRVLFFYASWCPICKPADVSLRENMSRIPEDMVVLRVNYSDPETNQEEKDLAEKYDVTYQHTFVQIDSQDTQVTMWNGGGIDELLVNSK